jgi:hypothetical protein
LCCASATCSAACRSLARATASAVSSLSSSCLELAGAREVGLDLASLGPRVVGGRLRLAQRHLVRLGVDLEQRGARVDVVALVDEHALDPPLDLGADLALAAGDQGARRLDALHDRAAPHGHGLDRDLGRRERRAGPRARA